ncbi:TIM barrel protein [Actinoplanes sp. NPDC051411]|uniref:hydroxypyruvate isomerase family protein n=1 Tax=Actinoplanes sp. NPDC051411 TaxID=3155522 RepID=UPI00342015D5
MMRAGRYELVANVSLLFTEVPLLDRFVAARDAGFGAVECWWPFPSAAPPQAEIDALLAGAGGDLAGMNFYAGDMAGGERGVLSHPGRTDEFASSLDVVAQVAERTGCAVFNALYGQDGPDFSPATAVTNLRTAADRLLPLGATVVLEPLTDGENGAYPLRTAADAIRVLDEAGRPNTGLLLDTYHLTNNGDDLLAVIRDHADRIRHVQLADAPGRHEPGTGRIDFRAVLRALETAGYDGRVAAEYRPAGTTTAGLGWIAGLA